MLTNAHIVRTARPVDLIAHLDRHNVAHTLSPSGLPYVVHISDPPTTEERLQLAACRLLRQPIVLVPGKCLSIDEWVEKYGEQGSADRQ